MKNQNIAVRMYCIGFHRQHIRGVLCCPGCLCSLLQVSITIKIMPAADARALDHAARGALSCYAVGSFVRGRGCSHDLRALFYPGGAGVRGSFQGLRSASGWRFFAPMCAVPCLEVLGV